MKNTNILYGIIGLLVGLGIAGGLCVHNHHRGNKDYSVTKGGMHQMADGKMMGNGSMEGMMSEMMSGLKGKMGDEFDKAFIDEMIIHHQGAIDMANEALKNAKHQEIKDLATAIISAQTKEINQMKSWKETWYGK